MEAYSFHSVWGVGGSSGLFGDAVCLTPNNPKHSSRLMLVALPGLICATAP